MTRQSIITIFFGLIYITICSPPAFALYSGLQGFSGEFIQDYEKAENAAVYKPKSVELFLTMLTKYKSPNEQAELNLRLGLLYNQQEGLIDHSKAVTYLSKALEYELPEETYIKILLWRGNSFEQIKSFDKALKDYLRGLLACSYYDLSTGWPEIKPSTVPIYMNSPDPENLQRIRDYRKYRDRINYVRFLLTQRYFFIDATKRVQTRLSMSDDQLLKVMEELSPDTSRFASIMALLKSENRYPIR